MALSEAKKAADKRHTAKLDNIMIRPYREEGVTIRTAAAAAGKSVQGYVLEAVREKMERERAGEVPSGSPAAEDKPGVVLVSGGGSGGTDICSRSTSLTLPDFQTGLDAEPVPKQESFLDVVKRLNAMTPEERERALGCDPESMERYRQEMERKRQRLAELNAKAGGLSRAEDAERRQLMMECKDYTRQDDSAQG